MSNLEPGCTAIIINGAEPESPDTNIGKIVTVVKFIGTVENYEGNDYWEVNIKMNSINGDDLPICRDCDMRRIDDHKTDEYFNENVDNFIMPEA